jgi:hypothetical protein
MRKLALHADQPRAQVLQLPLQDAHLLLTLAQLRLQVLLLLRGRGLLGLLRGLRLQRRRRGW